MSASCTGTRLTPPQFLGEGDFTDGITGGHAAADNGVTQAVGDP